MITATAETIADPKTNKPNNTSFGNEEQRDNHESKSNRCLKLSTHIHLSKKIDLANANPTQTLMVKAALS